MLMLLHCFCGQLIIEFVEKENIPLEGARPAQILLGRDTRPSGESLLEAAKQVRSLFPLITMNFALIFWSLFHLLKFDLLLFYVRLKGISSILGAVAIDMGIVTTPQLHWMVRARNKGLKASELDYFEQLSSSFRLV